MLSKYNVIIIKEAQFINNKELDILAYMNKPMLQSIIIFCYKGKSFDKEKNYTKKLRNMVKYLMLSHYLIIN